MEDRSYKKRLREWYDAYLEHWIPRYAFFSLIGCFVWSSSLYWITQYCIEAFGLPLHDLTTDLDRQVPFAPAWVSVYVLSFPFWAVSYALAARENSREDWFRFVFADMASRTVCGLIFLLYPTTNVRPEITGDGFWDWAMGVIYALDPPLDLFPSIHCLASLMCYLGIRRCGRIAPWYRQCTLLFAVLVFASTQFTKQHYLADILGGIVIGLGCFVLSRHMDGYRIVQRLYGWLDLKLFGNGQEDEEKENTA